MQIFMYLMSLTHGHHAIGFGSLFDDPGSEALRRWRQRQCKVPAPDLGNARRLVGSAGIQGR